jgi:hypothetical protein
VFVNWDRPLARIRVAIGEDKNDRGSRTTIHDTRRAFVSHLAGSFDVYLLDQCLGHAPRRAAALRRDRDGLQLTPRLCDIAAGRDRDRRVDRHAARPRNRQGARPARTNHRLRSGLQDRQGARSGFRRAWARRKRYKKSGHGHGDDGKTDPNDDRKDDPSMRLGRNAARGRGHRLLRRRIATGIVRRGSACRLLSGEQDGALVFLCARRRLKRAQGRSNNLPSKYE